MTGDCWHSRGSSDVYTQSRFSSEENHIHLFKGIGGFIIFFKVYVDFSSTRCFIFYRDLFDIFEDFQYFTDRDTIPVVAGYKRHSIPYDTSA